MTYPTHGGDRGDSSPDYPTTQFQAIRGDQPPAYEDSRYQPRQNPYEQPSPYEQQHDRRDPGQREYQRSEAPMYRDADRDAPLGERAARRGLPWGWLVLVAVLLVAAAGAGGYYVGHEKGKKAATSGPKHLLSHTAVEAYIGKQFGAANVQCYGGQDMPLAANSAFSCTAAGTSFVVLVKDPNTGSYQVLKAS